MTRRLRPDEYTVGWICALTDELTAAQEMLDEEHQDLPANGNDTNVYSLGRIGDHNVVLACLPAGFMGAASAASVAMQMKATFPAIRFGLMVGIGGGVPHEGADIRLGDVVVSHPGKGHGGVVQYDFGRSTPDGFEHTGFLNAPPQILLSAVTKLRSNQDRGRSSLLPNLSKLSKLPKFALDKTRNDKLFNPTYQHIGGEDDCESCAVTEEIQREERTNKDIPMVHYGMIASANRVMRHGIERDATSSKFGRVLCFEMEAAGLINSFPCLVIRGICSYADSHKNKKWQPYAAGTAAAYAKELLLVLPAADVARIQTVDEVTQSERCFYLPFLRNRHFVGRSVELDMLKQKLLVNRDCQSVAISGLGGIGKTQLALHFVQFVKENCPELSVFWVQALSMEDFEQGCTEIAIALGILQAQESKEDVKKLVRQRLCAKTAGKWSLIVDNADDRDLLCELEQTEGLLAFLPESDDGLTIFTTRHGRGGGYGLVREVSSSKVPPSGLRNYLFAELEYLPLAITQAAAYLNTNKSSITEYLRLLRSTEQDAAVIMSTDFGDKTRYRNSSNAVAKTWTITFNKILEQDKTAADLLAFISCIEWKQIPYSILPTTRSETALTDVASAVGTLCSYSFLERRGDKLDMHRLVHLATRIWIHQKALEVETREAAIQHLRKVFPSDDHTNRKIWRDYLPHAAYILKDGQCQDTKEKSILFGLVGQCLYRDGKMNDAVLYMQKSRDWMDRSLAEDHPDRLTSQHELASAYLANWQIKKAIELLEDIVIIKERALAEDHPDRLASQHELAGAYLANGQTEKAIELLEHVVTIERALAEDHPRRLGSQHELACAYYTDGQTKGAIELIKHVVTTRAQTLAEDNPSRVVSETLLANIYKDLSRRSGTRRNPALEAPQAVPHASALITASDPSIGDQELDSNDLKGKASRPSVVRLKAKWLKRRRRKRPVKAYDKR
ncbi:kinesin light chain [Drechslerella dactyloides]|uniref:Kinesin light chain n=1 Tax=Drechslerella dactyloides TaxID=74499 RepID=A0AAD6IVN9_DREDA|nr:kinesin light chain [Drechslerella dactyloides]